jgi:hypothetical protein
MSVCRHQYHIQPTSNVVWIISTPCESTPSVLQPVRIYQVKTDHHFFSPKLFLLSRLIFFVHQYSLFFTNMNYSAMPCSLVCFLYSFSLSSTLICILFQHLPFHIFFCLSISHSLSLSHYLSISVYLSLHGLRK